MQIYVYRDNQQAGPFSEAEIRAQLTSGAITRDSLVWWDGQAEWQPLGQTALGAVAAPAMMPPPTRVLPRVTSSGAVPVAATAGTMGIVGGTKRTSGLAIASMVLGIIGWAFILIFGPAAVITGHMARSKIRQDPTLKGEGMALAGLILGYIWIALIPISIIAISVLIALGNQVQGVFSTINSQIAIEQMTTNNAPAPDNTTNSPTATPTPGQ